MSFGLLTLIQRSAMETVQIAAIAVRTEKNFRFTSIRFSAVRQYCCYSKTPTEENGHALHPRRLYEDRATGRLDARPGLDGASKALRRGETLIVWKLDRLGRDLRHLISVVLCEGHDFSCQRNMVQSGKIVIGRNACSGPVARFHSRPQAEPW